MSAFAAWATPASSTAAPPANTPFGGTSSIFGQPQQQPQQPAQSAFGAQPATNGGLFGQTQPATGNLFGQSQPNGALGNTQQSGTTGLFGNNTTQPGGSGLFGANPAPAQQTGGLFGANPAPSQQTGGLFGGVNTNTQTSTGGLFGGGNNGQPATSLFGISKTPSGTGGSSLFGNTAGNTLPGGLFTQQQQQPAQQQTSGLFGNQTQPQQTSSLFGNQTQPQQTSSLFGSTNTNLFGGNPSNNAFTVSSLGGQPGLASSALLTSKGPVQAQADSQAQSAKMSEKIEGIYNAWNTASPHCRFLRVFYNLVDPNQVNLYGRPPNATNEALWQKAVMENPDPTCLVPVIAAGFDDLRDRVEAQVQQSAAHQERVKDIQSRIAALKTRHSDTTKSRLARLAAAQTQLTLRLVSFIQHLHLLIPSVRSSSIRPEEEELRQKLDAVESELMGGGGRVRGKLGELWAVVGAVKARQGQSGASSGEWKVVDEEGLAKIAQILSEQQAGLIYLTKVLKKDIKDLAVVMGTSPETAPEETFGVENLFNTSTLRVSHLRQ